MLISSCAQQTIILSSVVIVQAYGQGLPGLMLKYEMSLVFLGQAVHMK